MEVVKWWTSPGLVAHEFLTRTIVSLLQYPVPHDLACDTSTWGRSGWKASAVPALGTRTTPFPLRMYPMISDSIIDAYVTYLHGLGRQSTARKVMQYLTAYGAFLASRGQTFTTATVSGAEAYQAHLARPTAGTRGRGLARSTQAVRLGALRSFHRWLRRRGHALIDPMATLDLPRLPRRTVATEHLTQQEAQALMDTAMAATTASPTGSKSWAVAWRTAAMIAMAMATGRRIAGLCSLQLADLDPDRLELRVAREKGHRGRVLPVAAWAVGIVIQYRDHARPVLLRSRTSAALFLGERDEHISEGSFREHLAALLQQASVTNPDLPGFTTKRITPHSLRVTCARLLFTNGCPIRSVNEILLHRQLSTTTQYTPVFLEELRRAIIGVHPRA